jgi:predicted SAM-dependent methyltransferase
MLKLHLGCGAKYIPGYIHIDIKDLKHVDHKRDIKDLSIFDDNTVDIIYCCHVLEHFKRTEVLDVLKEWNRILKKAGVLRLSVPNFRTLAELYLKTNNISIVLGPIVGRQDDAYNIHYNVFDEEALRVLLKEAGFRIIYKYDWRKTEHCDIDDFSSAYIPHMDKKNGTLISLNVEAIK